MCHILIVETFLKFFKNYFEFQFSQSFLGLFEGTLTDLGSYDQCLSIVSNDLIGSPQYCLIDFSLPIPHPMPKHQNLFHKIKNLLPNDISNKTNNAFAKLANEASIFYWISLRIGICSPNKCALNDIYSLSKTGI